MEEKKKERKVRPRSESHANALEKFHAWVKAPFADNAAELRQAMIAHLKVKLGDDGIDKVIGF